MGDWETIMSDEDDSDIEIKKLLQEKERLKEKRKNSDKKELLAKLQQEVLNLKEANQSSSLRWKDSAGPSGGSKKSRNDNYNQEQRKRGETDDENVSEDEGKFK